MALRAAQAACIAAPKTNRSFTGYPRFCLQPRYRSLVCADNDNGTESQSWFRAVPSDELLDSVLVCAARTGRGKAIQYCQLRVVQISQSQHYATVVRFDFLVTHAGGLPCRITPITTNWLRRARFWVRKRYSN